MFIARNSLLCIKNRIFFFVLSETQYPWTNEGAVNGIYDSVLRKKLFPSDGSYFIILMFLTILIFVDVLEKKLCFPKRHFQQHFPSQLYIVTLGGYLHIKTKTWLKNVEF